MSNFKNYEHILRLVIALVVLVVVFLVVRSQFIPKDFWKYGHYRGGSVKENMDRPRNYAGSTTCKDCHEDKVNLWSKNAHKTVMCENCHGALLKHTEDPTSLKPSIPKKRSHCLLCHSRNISKPKSFPQIDNNAHNPGQKCFECHNPHDPMEGLK